MKQFTVKLLDGTPITGKTLREIKKIVGDAPFIPASAETVDFAKLRKRLRITIIFLAMLFYATLGAWIGAYALVVA